MHWVLLFVTIIIFLTHYIEIKELFISDPSFNIIYNRVHDMGTVRCLYFIPITMYLFIYQYVFLYIV